MLIKTTKAEKEWKTKIGTKTKGSKYKTTNVVAINPIITIIILNINDINIAIKGLRLSE